MSTTVNDGHGMHLSVPNDNVIGRRIQSLQEIPRAENETPKTKDTVHVFLKSGGFPWFFRANNRHRLLADAKLAKNPIQDIVRVNRAGHGT